jgi:hypothetical protein
MICLWSECMTVLFLPISSAEGQQQNNFGYLRTDDCIFKWLVALFLCFLNLQFSMYPHDQHWMCIFPVEELDTIDWMLNDTACAFVSLKYLLLCLTSD